MDAAGMEVFQDIGRVYARAAGFDREVKNRVWNGTTTDRG